jgi:hypothetical protein
VNGSTIERAYRVFAQRADARVDIDAWNAHAVRFFATRIGLTTDRRYPDAAAPVLDEVTFVVAPEGAESGLRTARARPRQSEDLALADLAEPRARGAGLSALARRCGMVWLVAREGDGDRLALRLAAILASVLLGPVLDPAGPDIFGVKTARERLSSPDLR